MGLLILNFGSLLLATLLLLVVLPSPASAFGAGNIPSIAQIEGSNFRHGDIEDMLRTIAFIKGHEWTTMRIKNIYFGNWLRDYSQAVDVGSLKGVSAPTIRILVWVLSFLSFGYATAEFEVTEERLGVYRPEEHIDNPKGYADDKDAREYDPRLRGPVLPVELEVDMNTGMKNYIANERGGWATSTGYVKFSFARSIHFGRLYTNGSGKSKGREADLCEALRCLGQALHCMEDFGAHTNYCELALRELGFHDVFPHCGVASEVTIRGKRMFPLVTGTFGAVDFLHSVLGEATDHFTQTEVEELDLALKGAERAQARSGSGKRGLFGPGGGKDFVSLLSQVPGLGGGLADTARDLQARSAEQNYKNHHTGPRDGVNTQFTSPPGSSVSKPPGQSSGIPGMSTDLDPIKIAKQIYPILEFRDRVVKAINTTIAKIPGLEALIEKISDTLTLFVLSLLAPFVRPIINAVSKSLKEGSTGVVEASANSQFEPWDDAYCTNPTHSMLSKDHFSNRLNGVAGLVAITILQYVAPRVLYAWQNPGVPVDEVMADIVRTFHHPALRDESLEIHRNMFNTVRKWVDDQPDRHNLNNILSSASVKAGQNHKVMGEKGLEHNHGALGGHGKTAGSIWTEIKSRDLGAMEGADLDPVTSYPSSSSGIGSPSQLPQSPKFGYHNTQRPAGSNYERPGSSSYLNSNYGPLGQYQQQPAYGAPLQQNPYGAQSGQYQQPRYGGPPGQYQQSPFGEQQATYGDPQYPSQGPLYGGYGGPPPSLQDAPYGQPAYPPQQPPYGGGGYRY